MARINATNCRIGIDGRIQNDYIEINAHNSDIIVAGPDVLYRSPQPIWVGDGGNITLRDCDAVFRLEEKYR